jgi:glycosyltransferase involved in cell wall biosynthesis
MADSKTYWLINQYASTPGTGMGGRHYYLAKELAKQGHTVFLVAAGYTHLLRSPPVLDKKYMIEPVSVGFNFVWVQMPKYSGAHDKKRILNWFIFAWKLLELPQIIKDKPDAILYSSPSLVGFLGAQRLAKKLKSKLAFEVRDIWPLTLIQLGGYSPKHSFIRFMQWVEDRAYHDSDVIISNLPNAVEHMVTRGMAREKFKWIPNGFNLSEFKSREPLAVTKQLALPKGKFIIGYTGTLGLANALNSFIEAARLLKDEVEIAFVLVGGGKEKAALVKQAEGLNNVYFVDPIPKKQIQSMLAEFDVCYIGWKKEPIYKFGIAPNKVPEYMLAEKPIIHSYSGECDPIEIAKSGLSVPAEDPQAVSNAILKLKGMHYQQYQQMGQNGRVYTFEHHDYSKLSQKLAAALSLN